MPLPRTLARWNKVGLNRVTKRVALWVPGFGVVATLADVLAVATRRWSMCSRPGTAIFLP
jgi:hypothetical protein